jgi:hypothetical protein
VNLQNKVHLLTDCLHSFTLFLPLCLICAACVSNQAAQNPASTTEVTEEIDTDVSTQSLTSLTATVDNVQLGVDHLFTQTAQEKQRVAPTETLNTAFRRALTATADEALVEDQMTHEIRDLTLTARVTPSPMPKPSSTSTSSPSAFIQELTMLFNIVDDVTSTRGSSTLLVQYWEDVQKSGSTQGCSTTTIPTIPNSVFVPDADLQASPNLRDAVQLINNGLSALRTDWTNFQFACNSDGLAAKLQTELANARVAADSFAAASIKLQLVQDGL